MNNVILIGMPGSGKSTLGVLVAKMTGKHFLDADVGLQASVGAKLSDVIREKGMDAFRLLEAEYLSSLGLSDTVLATGGSAVYYPGAMEHLKKSGKVVYLKASYEEIKKRVGDLVARGVVMNKGQTLLDLYNERTPLYEKYADYTVDVGDLEISFAAERVAQLFENN